MKSIVIEDDGKVTTDIVSELCNIELTQDVLIVSPYTKDFKDIVFEQDQFGIYGRYDYRPDRNNNYIIYPRIKVCCPQGLSMELYTAIPGMHIANINIEKLQGIELDKSYAVDPAAVDNFSSIGLSAIRGEYSIYNKIELVYREFSRDLFMKGISDARFSGLRIPINTKLATLRFVNTFIGQKEQYYNELYLIFSDYLYKQFPNFGGEESISTQTKINNTTSCAGMSGSCRA